MKFDVFNIDVFVVIFFCPHILFVTFRFRNFVLGVASRQTKDLFDFLSYFFFLSPPVFFFFFFFFAILYGCCCSFSSWKTVSPSFFSVAIYSHANECSVRYTVFESTMICCEFFLS